MCPSWTASASTMHASNLRYSGYWEGLQLRSIAPLRSCCITVGNVSNTYKAIPCRHSWTRLIPRKISPSIIWMFCWHISKCFQYFVWFVMGFISLMCFYYAYCWFNIIWLIQITTVSNKKIIHLTGRNSYARFDKVNIILSARIAYFVLITEGWDWILL